MGEIDELVRSAKRTRLLNPADRECSPEVYADERAGRLAEEVERLTATIADLRRRLEEAEELVRRGVANQVRLQAEIDRREAASPPTPAAGDARALADLLAMCDETIDALIGHQDGNPISPHVVEKLAVRVAAVREHAAPPAPAREPDEAEIERIARIARAAWAGKDNWDYCDKRTKEGWRGVGSAVLRAAPPAPTEGRSSLLICPCCGRIAPEADWGLAPVGSPNPGLRCPDCWREGKAVIPAPAPPAAGDGVFDATFDAISDEPPPAAGDARALAARIVSALWLPPYADDDQAFADRAEFFKRGETLVDSRSARIESVERLLREHAAPPAPSREALARALYDDDERRMGYQDGWTPWDSLDARGREKYVEAAEFIAGRLGRRVASPAPARPAAIVLRHAKGDPPGYDLHAFASDADARAYSTGLLDTEDVAPHDVYRIARVVEHPAAPAASQEPTR